MSKTVSVVTVFALVLTTLCRTQAAWDPTDHLVAHWAFDDPLNPYKATVGPNGGQNGQPLMIVPGKVGDGAAYMGGVSSMSVYNITPLQPTLSGTAITYAFWMYGDSALNFAKELGCAFQGDDLGPPHIGCFMNFEPHIGPNGVICWLNSEDSSPDRQLMYFGLPGELPNLMVDKWCYFALTDDQVKGELKLYIHNELGQLVRTVIKGNEPYPVNGPIQYFTIGSRPGAISEPEMDRFRGMMDDFRIYDTVLTKDQIGVLAGIPEPATLCLLGFGALTILRRRKNKVS